VILPIIIPASKPIAAPIDVLDSFITLIYLKSVVNESRGVVVVYS